MPKKQQYTPKQIELLSSKTPLAKLVNMPIFQGRNLSGMEQMRRKLIGGTVKKSHLPENLEPYKGEPVPLYKFITLAEATPERAKQWK